MQQSVRNSHNEQPSIEEPCKFKIQTSLEKGYARPTADSALSHDWAEQPGWGSVSGRTAWWQPLGGLTGRLSLTGANYIWYTDDSLWVTLVVWPGRCPSRTRAWGPVARPRPGWCIRAVGVEFRLIRKGGLTLTEATGLQGRYVEEDSSRLSDSVWQWHLVISECVDDTVRGQHRPKMQAGV